MNYIITNNRSFFEKIGNYNYCSLEDMVLPDIIAVDTETTSLNPWYGHMFSVQIGTGKDNYIIDLQQLGNELIFDDLKPYLQGKALLFHNASFDLGWFYKHNFFPEQVYDTMLASMILHNGKSYVRHSFGEVMKRELNIEYDKTEQKNIHAVKLSTTSAIQYAFNDVDRLLDCMKSMASKLRHFDMVRAFNIHCKYIKALSYMEVCGLPVDEDYWTAKIEKDKVAVEEGMQEVTEYIYDKFPQYRDTQIDMFDGSKKININLRSTQQVIPVFKELGINIKDDKDPNKETLNKNIIKRSGHEFVDIWLKYKEAEHDVTTYGENLIPKIKDGYFFTSFNPIKDTARISTRQGAVNILNFPSNQRTRECIRAKKVTKWL